MVRAYRTQKSLMTITKTMMRLRVNSKDRRHTL